MLTAPAGIVRYGTVGTNFSTLPLHLVLGTFLSYNMCRSLLLNSASQF